MHAAPVPETAASRPGTVTTGEGAHAEGETIFLDSIPRQAKRMALLMYRMSK